MIAIVSTLRYFPSVCQTGPPETSRTNRRKWNDNFQSNRPAKQEEWLVIFYFSPNPPVSEIYWREEGQSSGLSKWHSNFCSDLSNRQPKVDHFQKWSRIFHLTSDRNFQNFSQNGKRPRFHGFVNHTKPIMAQRKYCSLPVLDDSSHRPTVHGEMFQPLWKFQSRDITGP